MPAAASWLTSTAMCEIDDREVAAKQNQVRPRWRVSALKTGVPMLVDQLSREKEYS